MPASTPHHSKLASAMNTELQRIITAATESGQKEIFIAMYKFAYDLIDVDMETAVRLRDMIKIVEKQYT